MKIIETVLTIAIALFLIGYIWKINWYDSLPRILKAIVPGVSVVENISTYSDKKIYQDNLEAGEVVGKVVTAGDSVIFEKIINSRIDMNRPVQFKGEKLIINDHGSFIGEENLTIFDNTGVRNIKYQNVLEDLETTREDK